RYIIALQPTLWRHSHGGGGVVSKARTRFLFSAGIEEGLLRTREDPRRTLQCRKCSLSQDPPKSRLRSLRPHCGRGRFERRNDQIIGPWSIRPNPISFIRVAGTCAVILLTIPGNARKRKAVPINEAIHHSPPADQIVRKFFGELRHQMIQVRWIL